MRKWARKIWWRSCLRPYLVRKLEGSSPLLSFPMLIYVELEAEQDYVDNGFNDFKKIWKEKAESIAAAFQKTIEPPPEPGTPEWNKWVEELEAKDDRREAEERQNYINKCEQILKEHGYE